ncbi:MAG: polyprenyl synthetase [Bacteroidetes bacterium]|nr:MAG: polyprenyl synthetase [Bacteroidota bacterium]
MHTIQELATIVNNRIKNLDIYREPHELYTPISYTLEGSGKRLRPVLTMMVCEMYDGEINDAINPALGIEIFHNFTLLHDDIMDEAPIRRGRDTVYKKWSPNVAILSGDTMFAIAYDFVCKTKDKFVPAIMKSFCRTSIEVCEGQQYDMNFEEEEDTTIPEYLNMIRLKTAVAVATSMEIGAIIAEAPQTQITKIYQFGEHLGMAFQLQDDLLDSFGDQEKFGKRIGGDILANKKTYIYLKALEIASEEQRKTLKELYMSKDHDPDEKIKKVKAIFSALDIPSVTNKLINDYFDKAMACYEELSPKEEKKQILKEFAYMILRRDK